MKTYNSDHWPVDDFLCLGSDEGACVETSFFISNKVASNIGGDGSLFTSGISQQSLVREAEKSYTECGGVAPNHLDIRKPQQVPLQWQSERLLHESYTFNGIGYESSIHRHPFKTKYISEALSPNELGEYYSSKIHDTKPNFSIAYSPPTVESEYTRKLSEDSRDPDMVSLNHASRPGQADLEIAVQQTETYNFTSDGSSDVKEEDFGHKETPGCSFAVEDLPNEKELSQDTEINSMQQHKRQKKMAQPRIAIKTRSEIDVLDDGYKWRKYGQKAVKNNCHPRSYYRCTQTNCLVKKRVERFREDSSIVMTTYQGIHNHHCDNIVDMLAYSHLLQLIPFMQPALLIPQSSFQM